MAQAPLGRRARGGLTGNWRQAAQTRAAHTSSFERSSDEGWLQRPAIYASCEETPLREQTQSVSFYSVCVHFALEA